MNKLPFRILFTNQSQNFKKCVASASIRYNSSGKIIDTETHTGQVWDSNDYRMVRFTNAPKQVNNSWAVNLIASVPAIEVDTRVVWCDGGSGPEGHPKVYINLDKPGEHSCGYCGLRFVKKDDHHH